MAVQIKTRYLGGVRCYDGDIVPADGVVMVFGSNPEGRHGAGAARVARERFGARYGVGEGLTGSAYALPTKDLRVAENRGLRSIPPERITASVKRMYAVAAEHPDKLFCVAYRNVGRASLNGYTGIEMIDMFNAAGAAPENVVFSAEWAATRRLMRNAQEDKEDNNLKNNTTMPNIRFFESESQYYSDRTRKNAEQADITLAVAVDYNTAGERATERVAGDKYIRLPIDRDGVSAESVRTEAQLAALEFIEKVQAAGLPMDGVTVNVAGNGIYTLARHGITQEQVDTFMTEFFRQVREDGRMTVSAVRSGGQTGLDEAGVKAALANGIDATVLAPKGWMMRGANNVDVRGEAAFKERFTAAIAAAQAVEPAAPEVAWARFAPDGYEVSTKAATREGKALSALNATFLPGTVLAIGDELVDVGGKSVEEVYQVDVKRSGKGMAPDVSSVLYVPEGVRDGASRAELEDVSYERGFFPLWAVWAAQHPEEIEALRAAAAGRTLTDAFATTRVSQARALSEILAGRTLNTQGVVVDRETLLSRRAAAAPAEGNPAEGMADAEWIAAAAGEVVDAAQAAKEAAAQEAEPENEEAQGQEAEKPEEDKEKDKDEAVREERFALDRDVSDLAYAVTFGGSIFDEERTAALLGRLAAMTPARRGQFREAVLTQLRALYPEAMEGATAAARQARGYASPAALLDDVLVRADGAQRLASLKADIDALEKEIDTLMDRKEKEEDYAVKEAINRQAVPLLARRRELQGEAGAIEKAMEKNLRIGGRTELDVSARGQEQFTLSDMRFERGTRLGVIDISNMSIADVYARYVAQSPVGTVPKEGTVVYAGADAAASRQYEMEYRNGILPLVTLWAEQNRGRMMKLRPQALQITPQGIAPLRISDSVAGRFSAARALTDIFNGRGAQYPQETLARYFSEVPRPELHPDLTADRLEGYDVYTVGTGVRSDRQFWSLVPRGTDVIVDVRPFRNMPRKNPDAGDFKSNAMAHTAKTLNMEYRELPAASGTLPIRRDGSNIGEYYNDPRVVSAKTKTVEKDGKKHLNVVYDYAAFAEDEGFKAAMEQVRALVAEGKKVCIVGSRADASFDARGLLVGQALDAMGVNVAHIDTSTSGGVRIRSQEAIVRSTLGRGKTLRGKDFGGVTYQSDRTFTLPAGEEVVALSINKEDDVQERLRLGEMRPSNYGVDVDFRKVDGADYMRGDAGETQAKASILENIKYADFSVNFYAQKGDPQSRVLSRAALYGIDLALPSQKEDFYDEARIHNAAQKIARTMSDSLMQRKLSDDALDLEAVRLFVGGSTMPNIGSVTQYDEDADRGLVSAKLSNAGFSLDDATGISQEDVNHYVREVLAGVQRQLDAAPAYTRDFGENYELRVHVGEVTSNYDSGVGEAAITAAQALSRDHGMKPVVIYTSPVVTVDENDTSRGVEHVDEAMFRNRARGIRENVTLEMLKEQIEAKEVMDQGAVLRPGLKDEHFVALWDLGVDNATMLDLMDLARAHDVVILDAVDFGEFVDNARGYVDLPEGVNAVSARAALADAERKVARWKEDGITVVSAASPLYPESLDRMPDTERARRHTETIVESEDIIDGEQRRVGVEVSDTGFTETVEDAPMKIRRPALLWVKGDLSLLNAESVALIQPEDSSARKDIFADRTEDRAVAVTSEEDRNAVRRFVAVAAEEQIPLVTALENGPDTALDMVEKNGRVIAVSDDGIPTYDVSRRRIEELDAELSRTFRVLSALRSTPQDALAEGMTALRENGFVGLDSFGDLAAAAVPETASVFMENKDLLLKAAEDYPSPDVRDSLRRHSDALVAQKAVRSKMLNDAEDATQRIVDGGGLVMSETPPGRKAPREREDDVRGSRLVAWMGNAVAVVSQAAASNPSIVEILAKLVYMPFYITNEVAVATGLLDRSVKRTKEKAANRDDRDIQELKADDIAVVEAGEDSAHAIVAAARQNAAEADRAQERDLTPEEEQAQEVRFSERRSVPMLEPWRRIRDAAEYVRTSVADKMEAAFTPSLRLMETRIDVLHFGRETVFVVPEGQPDIEKAVKERYGEDARIMDPFTGKHMVEDWRHGTVTVDGTTEDRWPDVGDTRPLRGGFDRERVYFYRGRIMGLMDVPNGAMGLPLPRERRQAVEAWAPFMKAVREMQRTMQREAGFSEDAQLRFANAEYIHIPDGDTVEVRRGDRVRCRIWLEDGEIKAVNMPFSNDVQEYHETPVYPVLENIPRGIGANDLRFFLDDIRETLKDRPLTEQRAVQETLSDRALMEEYEEQIEQGFIVPREENGAIASTDVAWAAKEGAVPEKTEMRTATEEDRMKIYAAAARQLDRDAKKMVSLSKTIEASRKELDSGDDEERGREMADKIADAYAVRRDIARRMADLRDAQEAAAYSPSLAVVSDDGRTGKMTVSMGGYQVSLSRKGLKEEQVLAARDEIRANMSSWQKEEVKEEKKEEFVREVRREKPQAFEEKKPEGAAEQDSMKEEKAAEKEHEVPVGEIKVFNIHREADLMKDPGYVYIGRARAGQPKNILSNPFTSIKDKATMAEFVCDTRDDTITKYRDYCEEKYKNDPVYRKALDKLAERVNNGENLYLGCFCKPLPCHGDILREKILSIARDLRQGQAEAKTPEKDPKQELAELGEWLAAAEKDPKMKETEEYRRKVARVQELVKESAETAPEEAVRAAEGKGAASPYVKVAPVNEDISKGFREDGTFQLLGKDGKPLSKDWFKHFYAPVEGFSVLMTADERYRYFDFGAQKMIGGRYLQAANFQEGFALVQRDDKRMNYLKPDGTYLSGKDLWFDDARSFSEGKARVRIATTVSLIDTRGVVVKVIADGQEKKAGKGKDGRDLHQHNGQTPGGNH